MNICICCCFPTPENCIGCSVPCCFSCGEQGFCPVCMILENHRYEKRLTMPYAPPALLLYRHDPWSAKQAIERSNEETEEIIYA